MAEIMAIHQSALENLIPKSEAVPSLVQKSGKFIAQCAEKMEEVEGNALVGVKILEARLQQEQRKNTRVQEQIVLQKTKTAIQAGKVARLKHKLKEHLGVLQQSKRLQDELRHLSHQLFFAQEEERKKISRALHDEISATLAAINLELTHLAVQATEREKTFHSNISRTQQLVLEAVESIHRFARDLRPASLDDLGLIPALHSFTKALSKETGLRISLTIFAGVEQLRKEVRTVIYRVLQEALSNVAKHADATHAEVTLTNEDGCLKLMIKDDGKSFDASKAFAKRKPKRLGLLGMRERIEMVGGRFTVESHPNQGTCVKAEIPYLSPRQTHGRE